MIEVIIKFVILPEHIPPLALVWGRSGIPDVGPVWEPL